VTGTSCRTCGAPVSEATGFCAACGAASQTDTFVAPLDSELSTNPNLSDIPTPDPTRASGFGPGQSFADRYTIVERIGDGGMGEVYKAIDRRRQQRTVALKLIHSRLARRGEALRRFRRELDLAQKVSHANVCRLHDLGEVEGQLYICMEYIDGQTLDDLIRTMGRLSPIQTATLGRQICDGLQAVHEQGIVHRDLKPSNVMVDRSGHAIVMDFGMAYHPEAEKLTHAGMVVGTLAYVAPEQARGVATDTRSDVYALGLLLYEMLTGRRPPGDGAPLPLALRDPAETCPPPRHWAPEVPEVLDAVVMRCLYRDPASRFSSMAEVGEALARASDALASTLYPPARPAAPAAALDDVTTAEREPRWDRLRSLSALLGAVLVGALLYRLGHCPASPPVSIAFCPLSYVGPKEHSNLAELVPLFLSDQLRARKGCTVAPFASARTFEAKGDPGLVATQLDVGFVVQGEVSVDGPRIHTVLRLRKAGATEARSREFEGKVEDALGKAQAMAEWITSEVGFEQPATGPASPARRSAMEPYLQGRIYLEGWDVERNYARAEEAFRAAIGRDPSFAEAHARLALALFKDYEETRIPERVPQAEEAAERAVALAPELPEARLAQGVIQLGRGLSAEAAATLQRAQDLATADDVIVRRIAEAYANSRRTTEAESLFRRAISLRPDYWENQNAFGRFLVDAGRYTDAESAFREVVRLRPNADVGYTNLAGTLFYHRGPSPEVLAMLERSLALSPTAQAHNFLGFAYYGSGRFADAEREFAAAVASGSEHLVYQGNLGDALRQQGKTVEAQAAYARAIALGRAQVEVNPKEVETRGILAMSLAGAGRCTDAPMEAERAIVDGSDRPTIHYYAAVAYAVCGQRKQAVEQAVRAITGGLRVDVATNPDLKGLLADPAVETALSRSRAQP
jgi:serine/threonine-protein kinase